MSVIATETADMRPRPNPIRTLAARVAPAISRVFWALLSLSFFAGIWEVCWALGWANPLLLPPPHIFLGSFAEQANNFSPTLRWQVGQAQAQPPNPIISVLNTIAATMLRVFAGLSLATIFATALGIGVRRYAVIDRLVLPTVYFLAPVSPIAWLPIAIFLFGIGDTPAIFMVFIALFFTMSLATISEIDGVNVNLVNAARTMGATRGQIYRRVIIPAIAPGLFMVLRLNMFAAWMVVLLAEATGVGSGLGQIIMLARNTFNPSLVFFTVTLIGILGFTTDWVLRWVQEKYLFWSPRNLGGRRA